MAPIQRVTALAFALLLLSPASAAEPPSSSAPPPPAPGVREPFPLPATPNKATSGLRGLFGGGGGGGGGAGSGDGGGAGAGNGDGAGAAAAEGGRDAAAGQPSPEPDPHPERTLLLAVELCRHGDRTPLYEYPKDALPLRQWPEGVGELTAVGQRAHYELGQRLRKRYVDSGFLPFSFSARDVYLRSTTIDRALMSAYAQMAGMFPSGTGQVSDVGTRFGQEVAEKNATGLPGRWQPVPIHTVALKRDALLIAGANCPRHGRIMAQKLGESEWLDRESREQALLKKLGSIVGLDRPLSLREVNHVNDIWVVYDHHNVPLPDGVTSAIRKRVQDIATWLVLFGNKGDELRRLQSGLLLNEIKTRMKLSSRKLKGTLSKRLIRDVRKFVLYSAHDSTVAAALSALNVKFDYNPPYNSTLIWELYHDKNNGKFLVSLEYNSKKMHIPGCPEPHKDATDIVCDMDQYFKVTKAMTIASSAMRMRECLTGFHRQLSFWGTWTNSDQRDGINGEYDDASFDDGHQSSIAFRLVVLLALLCISLGVIYQARVRYGQYFPVKSDEGNDRSNGERRASVFEGHRDRSILL